MNVAAKIIEKFGGVRPMAAALKKAPTTVQYWKDAGHIPARHQGAVLRAAKHAGIELVASELISEAA